jgi:hypothetical protein
MLRTLDLMKLAEAMPAFDIFQSEVCRIFCRAGAQFREIFAALITSRHFWVSLWM